MQQGLTINAYQDGNRLIVSFENAPDSLQTAILSMLGGVIKHSIAGLAPATDPDYDGMYQCLAEQVKQQVEEQNVKPEPTVTQPIDETPVTMTEPSETTEKPSQPKKEEKPSEKKYTFFEGEYKGLSPAEALDKDNLKALLIFYNKRNEKPYNNAFMKKIVKKDSLEYVKKITENLKQSESAFTWLFTNYNEGTSNALKSMRYEPSLSGIKELCSKESLDLCKTTITMLFEKMISEM